MRSFWSGELVWGFIQIPVKLYTATKELTPQFHQLHGACGTRISMVRRCDKCQKDLAFEEIVKGHEVAPGEYVAFTKEEIAELNEFDGKGAIQILHTVAPSGVNPVFLDTTYWVGPASKRANAYITLRDELTAGNLVAIATVALRTRVRLCLLAAQAGLITLTTLHYAAEVVEAKEIVPPDIVVREQERTAARALLVSMTDDFRPESHNDEYVKKLLAAVQEKVEGGQTVDGGSPMGGAAPGGEVVDLAEMLERSIRARDAANKAAGKGSPGKADNDAKPEAPKAEGKADNDAKPEAPKAEGKGKGKGKKEREGHTPSRRAS